MKLVTEWIENPPPAEEMNYEVLAIDYDDKGTPWVKISAQVISDLMLERYNVAFSERRNRTALNGLVEKGYLLRTQHIGVRKWSRVYFYRLPVAQQPPASE